MHSVFRNELFFLFFFGWPLSFLLSFLLRYMADGGARLSYRRAFLLVLAGPIGATFMLLRLFAAPWRSIKNQEPGEVPPGREAGDGLQRGAGWTLTFGIAALGLTGLVIFLHPGFTEFYHWLIRAHSYLGYVLGIVFVVYLYRHLRQYASPRAAGLALMLIANLAALVITLNWRKGWDFLLVNLLLIWIGTQLAKKLGRDPKLQGGRLPLRAGAALMYVTALTFLTGAFIAEPFNSTVNNNMGLYVLYIHGEVPMLIAPLLCGMLLAHLRPRAGDKGLRLYRVLTILGLPLFVVVAVAGTIYCHWKWYGLDAGPHLWPPHAIRNLYDAKVQDRTTYTTHSGPPPVPSKGAYPAGYEKTLGDFTVCDQRGCHPELVKEWQGSPHRFAASNILFRRVIERMEQERGDGELNVFCLNCHDPVGVLSPSRDKGVALEELGESMGVTCKSCHTMAFNLPDGRRAWDGHYELRPEQSYPVELGEPGYKEKWARHIRWDLRLHFKNYSIPEGVLSGEICAACHVASMPDFVTGNDAGLSATDIHTSWKNSSYNKPGENCVTCHMPYRSWDVRKFPYPDHRTPGLNLVLAEMVEGDEETMERAREMDTFVREMTTGKVAWPDTKPFLKVEVEVPDVVVPGEYMTLFVYTTNSGVGHYFHAGPSSLNEVWLELVVTDATGAEVFHSGALDPESREMSSEARRLGAELLDENGDVIRDCSIWRLAGVKQSRRIKPGEMIEDQFDFPVPEMVVGPLMAVARWNHRRASQAFVDWAFDGNGPVLPVVEIGADETQVKLAH
jgi:Cytochrome c554 and c-prime